MLPDGNTDYQIRWFWLRNGIKIRWGVTTTPRRDHPEDANHGARVFAQGKKSGLDEAARILLDAVAATAPINIDITPVVPPTEPPTREAPASPQPEADP